MTLEPIQAIHVKQLNDQGNGTVTVAYPAGSTTVLSIQPDGEVQTRPQGTAGPYELAKIAGSSLVYAPLGAGGSSFLVPYAAAIPNV